MNSIPPTFMSHNPSSSEIDDNTNNNNNNNKQWYLIFIEQLSCVDTLLRALDILPHNNWMKWGILSTFDTWESTEWLLTQEP